MGLVKYSTTKKKKRERAPLQHLAELLVGDVPDILRVDLRRSEGQIRGGRGCDVFDASRSGEHVRTVTALGRSCETVLRALRARRMDKMQLVTG